MAPTRPGSFNSGEPDSTPLPSKANANFALSFRSAKPFTYIAPPISAISDAARPSGTAHFQSRRGFTITDPGFVSPLKCASSRARRSSEIRAGTGGAGCSGIALASRSSPIARWSRACSADSSASAAICSCNAAISSGGSSPMSSAVMRISSSSRGDCGFILRPPFFRVRAPSPSARDAKCSPHFPP